MWSSLAHEAPVGNGLNFSVAMHRITLYTHDTTVTANIVLIIVNILYCIVNAEIKNIGQVGMQPLRIKSIKL